MTQGNKELFQLMHTYRKAVEIRDEFTIRKIQIEHPQHQHIFSACFKAVTKRLRFEKKHHLTHPLGPTP